MTFQDAAGKRSERAEQAEQKLWGSMFQEVSTIERQPDAPEPISGPGVFFIDKGRIRLYIEQLIVDS